MAKSTNQLQAIADDLICGVSTIAVITDRLNDEAAEDSIRADKVGEIIAALGVATQHLDRVHTALDAHIAATNRPRIIDGDRSAA